MGNLKVLKLNNNINYFSNYEFLYLREEVEEIFFSGFMAVLDQFVGDLMIASQHFDSPKICCKIEHCFQSHFTSKIVHLD
jgi:hypothetical protein